MGGVHEMERREGEEEARSNISSSGGSVRLGQSYRSSISDLFLRGKKKAKKKTYIIVTF